MQDNIPTVHAQPCTKAVFTSQDVKNTFKAAIQTHCNNTTTEYLKQRAK